MRQERSSRSPDVVKWRINQQTGSNVDELMSGLVRYALPARSIRATIANLKRELSAGHYPLVVIERKNVPSLLLHNPFAEAHWVGVRGYDANRFMLVDALVPNGNSILVDKAVLATALSGSTWNGVKQGGYIGLSVEMPEAVIVVIPEPQPEPDDLTEERQQRVNRIRDHQAAIGEDIEWLLNSV